MIVVFSQKEERANSIKCQIPGCDDLLFIMFFVFAENYDKCCWSLHRFSLSFLSQGTADRREIHNSLTKDKVHTLALAPCPHCLKEYMCNKRVKCVKAYV